MNNVKFVTPSRRHHQEAAMQKSESWSVVGNDNKNNNNDDHDHDDQQSSDDSQHQQQQQQSSREEQDDDDDDDGMDSVRKLAIAESKGIRLWKAIVVVTIVVTAALISFGTFNYVKQSEEDDFETSFHLLTGAIEDVTNHHVEILFGTLRNLAQQITKEAAVVMMMMMANESSSSFPFVTVPLFEVLGSQARREARLESIYWGPTGISPENKDAWVNYTLEKQNWILESRWFHLFQTGMTWDEVGYDNGTIPDFVYDLNSTNQMIPPTIAEGPWEPLWQISPPPVESSIVNFNMRSNPHVRLIEAATDAIRHGLIDYVRNNFTMPSEDGGDSATAAHEAYHEGLVDADRGDDDDGEYSSYTHPHAHFVEPIFDDIYELENSMVVGHIISVLTWDAYLINLLPDGVKGITVVVRNTCQQAFTYELNGPKAFFVGEGDFHDTKYDKYKEVIPFYDSDEEEELLNTPGHCLYSFHVFPTKLLEDEYRSNLPIALTIAVASAFAFLFVVYFVYDLYVNRRNQKVLRAAARSTAIVSSLFPSNVRERLYQNTNNLEESRRGTSFDSNGRTRLKKYMNKAEGEIEMSGHDGETDDFMYKTKPIADLFPETTVMFADIAGFTAWSSAREPTQVFILLETIYKAFDDIARKRRVFKVETVGDCYVAVSGLPDPRKDHAIVMARFAFDCLHRMRYLTRRLEVILGPETADLDMRFGLHSGPVTAGVLRGERSRFQLFGDTMNTASRMESTGTKGRIQVSQDTADLIIAGGKALWLTPREDTVIAKGKGEMTTYWLVRRRGSASAASDTGTDISSDVGCSEHSVATPVTGENPEMFDRIQKMQQDKTLRLVQWNVEVLSSLLKKIVHRRVGGGNVSNTPQYGSMSWRAKEGETPLDEVVEIIALPTFDKERQSLKHFNAEDVDLGEAVEEQLREYCMAIAEMYRNNPFHNFEHASHVTMSVVKLLSRIVTPDMEEEEQVHDDIETTLHRYTYGITSDPLTQFACVFSALIHDVDHSGVPNTTLIKECPELASYYRDKSVAEQNSVDISWDLLASERFSDLRKAIYQTEEEKCRFRKLVVNSVMATDIMDKDLKALRNARWEKAFSDNRQNEPEKDDMDRKATIVIEHLIQASDVAHTMQHWHIYRKWNQRLFEEMYRAYMEGRADQDPSSSWYKGEIGFFDFYIIPLAKKLKDCGVFGVSSDEYLNYAEKNREEWQDRGEDVVASMVEEAHRKYGTKDR